MNWTFSCIRFSENHRRNGRTEINKSHFYPISKATSSPEQFWTERVSNIKSLKMIKLSEGWLHFLASVSCNTAHSLVSIFNTYYSDNFVIISTCHTWLVLLSSSWILMFVIIENCHGWGIKHIKVLVGEYIYCD